MYFYNKATFLILCHDLITLWMKCHQIKLVFNLVVFVNDRFVDNTRIKSTLPLPVLKNTPDVDRTNVDKEWFIGENITEEELLGAGYSLGVVVSGCYFWIGFW